MTVMKRKLTVLKKQSRHKFTKTEMFNKVTSDLDSTVAHSIQSQIKLNNTLPKGRSYTLNDKILGLILHKQSGRDTNFSPRYLCCQLKIH